jgi:hypothetical protein
MFCRRSGPARWGHLTLAQRGSRRARSELLWSGVERPCSAGIRSERVEAVGAAGRTTWTPVVGLADETSERGRLCSISLVRSSRRQPSTTECPGGDDLPQGGLAASIILSGAQQTQERTLEIVNIEKKMRGGQNYSGANLRRR